MLSFRGQGTRHASFHLQRDSLQRYKSLDRKSVSFRHPSFRMSAGHRRSFDENATQGMPHTCPSLWIQEAKADQLQGLQSAISDWCKACSMHVMTEAHEDGLRPTPVHRRYLTLYMKL